MDKFKQLESFVAIARLGSLSAAAREEGIAPAMMGRRLDALESRLGTKLLLRSTRRLSLTDEGRSLLEEAQRILRDLNDTETRIAQGGIQPVGHLRISAPMTFGRACVAPLVPRFIQKHPRIAVTLDLNNRQVDLIAERYDCAIRLDNPEEPGVMSLYIAETRRVVVAAPEYLQKHGRPRNLDDLEHHHCLSPGTENSRSTAWLFKNRGRIREIQVGNGMTSNNEDVLLDWALAGCGLVRRQYWEISKELETGRLVSVLDDYAVPPGGIYATLAEQKHPPLRVQAFVDLLRAHCTQQGWSGPH